MKLNLQRSLPQAIGAILPLTFATFAVAESQSKVPNIVIIVSDDQGYADVSFNPLHKAGVSTPNIDRIARDGVIFEEGYVTAPMCLPSRAALLTGRYQQRSGVHWADVATQPVQLLPSYLRSAGYVSTALGKWHETVDIAGAGNPTVRGFDEFYGFNHGGRNYFDLSNTMTDFAPLYRAKKKLVGEQGYLTHRLTEEAVDFIQRHREEPFILYLAYNAVHTPLQAHIEDVEKHHVHSQDPARKILLAMIDYLDAGVGQVLGALDDAGIYENTLIIFLTDNGGSVLATHADNAPLNGEKLQMLEGGIRVPFVVSWPARFSGARTLKGPVSTLDILPTCLAAADQPIPASLDGANLLPVLEGKSVLPARDLFWWWRTGPFAGQWAIRSGQWKLHRFPDSAGEIFALFDLSADPGESQDLAGSEPKRLAELRARFERWSKQADASAPAPLIQQP